MRVRFGAPYRKTVLNSMLEARELSASYSRNILFSGVSFKIAPGQAFCISGPSGCGKTTLGRILAGLQAPAAGQAWLDGAVIKPGISPVQYLYQSPLTAMNPRWRIKEIVEEPGPIDPTLAEEVGFDPDWETRFPHELSGGQLQRVSLLRALGTKPRYLIADEITAELDPVAQAQIWYLLKNLMQKFNLGVVAISHNEDLLARISHAENHLRLEHYKQQYRL